MNYPIRPWQHVLEPLSGYLLLVEPLFTQGQSYAESWNFWPRDEDAQPVQWLVEQLCGAWGGQSSWSLQPGEHPHVACFLKLGISKARQRLPWAPRWSVATALSHIMAWHQSWLTGEDMRAVCFNQIAHYQVNVSL